MALQKGIEVITEILSREHVAKEGAKSSALDEASVRLTDLTGDCYISYQNTQRLCDALEGPVQPMLCCFLLAIRATAL